MDSCKHIEWHGGSEVPNRDLSKVILRTVGFGCPFIDKNSNCKKVPQFSFKSLGVL